MLAYFYSFQWSCFDFFWDKPVGETNYFEHSPPIMLVQDEENQ